MGEGDGDGSRLGLGEDSGETVGVGEGDGSTVAVGEAVTVGVSDVGDTEGSGVGEWVGVGVGRGAGELIEIVKIGPYHPAQKPLSIPDNEIVT